MSNPDNDLHDKDADDTRAPQGERVQWTTFPIAVPRELKARATRTARGLGLKPSQWGRMLIADAVNRAEREAA